MGYNTTVVVMNDALNEIKNDPKFGEKLSQAVMKVVFGSPVDVAALNYMNAATVIESHHADGTAIVAVGGNYGVVLGYVGGDPNTEEGKLHILKELARRMGYNLTKKK